MLKQRLDRRRVQNPRKAAVIGRDGRVMADDQHERRGRMDTQALCQRCIAPHPVSRRRMGIGQNGFNSRRLKPEIAHESKIASVIKLVWLPVKLLDELPKLATIGGNLAELGGCLAGFVTADSGQRPMAEDHLDIVRVRGLIIQQRLVHRPAN